MQKKGVVLKELLLEDDEAFIEAAYGMLLHRRPDAGGGRPYLRALRNGKSKLQILYEISNSEECSLVGGHIEGLCQAYTVQEKSGVGIEDTKLPPFAVMQVTCVDHLLDIEDADKFIQAAFWVLLKRPPDGHGFDNYLEKMSGGFSKLQVLWELVISTEGQNFGLNLPGLQSAFAHECLSLKGSRKAALVLNSSPAIVALPDLLTLNAGRFVDAAYLTLLKRMPDPEGYKYRLTQLFAGVAKVQILSEISASKEAAAIKASLQGLSGAVALYKIACFPVMGAIIKSFANIEGNSIRERHQRAIAQRLYRLEVEVSDSFR